MNSSNRRSKSWFAPLLLALLAAVHTAASAQEVAGRVLVSAGEVTLVRGAERIAAQRGTEVRSGDTIQVGARSNTQIRFTDESIIALRPETTFRVTDYAFRDKDPQSQRSFYNLVAGGMRTVTGLIGKLNKKNYRVSTETATIGIRGTHFSLVECNNSCRNPNGSLAPNGTYGGVTDGRISVTNQTGEHVFGADQYFRVAGNSAAPQRLIAPPGFLRDTLEGRTRNQRAPSTGPAAAQQAQGQAAQSGTQVASVGSDLGGLLAQTGAGAGTSDSGLAAAVTATTTSTVLATNIFQSTTDAATSGPFALLQPTNSGTVFYHLLGAVNVPVDCAGSYCDTVIAGDFTLAVNLTLQRAGLSANFITSGGDKIDVGTPSAASGIPITVSGGQVTFSGTFNLADFPQNQGAFRCSTCAPGNLPGYLQSMTVTGSIIGGMATLVFTGVDTTGPNTITLTLTQATPPNNSVAAITTPRQGGGADSRSYAFWNAIVDPSTGMLLGAGAFVGAPLAVVSSATNTVDGSAPSAGNLVWGHWSGAGAQIIDTNYVSFTTGGSAVEPWITGTAPNALPPSLGTLNFVPVGSFMTPSGLLNSASLTADFVNRSISLSVNATNMTASNTFQLNAVTGFSPISGRFSAGFNGVTCTGPCTGGTPAGSFGGFFSGPNAEGAGLAFSAGFGTGSGGVTGVVAFKR